MCAGAGTAVSSRLSANSSNHSGRPRKRSSASRLPSFLFGLGFLIVIRTILLVAGSSLRSNTEPEDELDETCFHRPVSKKNKFEHRFANSVSAILNAENLRAGIERWDDECTFVISIREENFELVDQLSPQRCKLLSNHSVFNGFGLADSNSCFDAARGTVNLKGDAILSKSDNSLAIWLVFRIRV